MRINGTDCHDYLTKTVKPKLSYSKKCNYPDWTQKVREIFIELTGLDLISKNACDDNFTVVGEKQKDGYKQIRFEFESEKGSVVPVYILIPDGEVKKRPVAITLQGHSTGFHNSVAEPKYPSDEDYMPRGAFAVQAVKEGYVAVAIEQRGMGERKAENTKERALQLYEGGTCFYEQMTASMFGRTLIGERCWDIKRTIDMLAHFDKYCDFDKIFITGNSGGGTASYYAACYDDRIKLCAPSCSFCSYGESILKMLHCACNYIPHIYKYVDMQDIACLIAPRKLLIIAGKEDSIFLIKGVREGFETVKKIYAAAGVPEKCKLVETEKGHWWCADIVWREIRVQLNNL